MAKQYKVLVNTGKEENNKAVDVQQFSGDKGQPVRIKAQAGAKYQLQEPARGKNVGPDYVKAKRVGKNLHILFEGETEASLIIEDYYGEMAPGYNGVIGQAENGSFYEYIPEDPRVPGLIPELAEGGQAVNVALGGAEVTPVGAAVAVAAFPLLGALGLLGAAGAAAYVANKDGTTPTGITGALDPNATNADGKPNDSGTKGDNRTNDATPTLKGTAPAGSTATYNLYNHDKTGAQVWIKNTLTSVSLSASPLMLDLNGDGVQTTTLANGVQFVCEAAKAIESFTNGMAIEQYKLNALVQAAVERKFEIIGEALNQLSKSDPMLAAMIPDVPLIVAFRNQLIHGYAAVNVETVWSAIQISLPPLLLAAQAALAIQKPSAL
jgi:uncharacterized protein with HEPN domain